MLVFLSAAGSSVQGKFPGRADSCRPLDLMFISTDDRLQVLVKAAPAQARGRGVEGWLRWLEGAGSQETGTCVRALL